MTANHKFTGCDSPYSVKLDAEASAKHGINYAPVGCGKCYNCRYKRISGWSFRLQEELKVSNTAYFITLTYDTHHVPITTGRYPMTLKKKDLQDFLKRLRYYDSEYYANYSTKAKQLQKPKKIKYYGCGEYGGSKKKRPHYHLILFNVVDPNSIYKAWATAIVEKGVTIGFHPFGIIDIDEDVNATNIEYVLKYICKDDQGIGKAKNDFRIPEFSLMSKGLGKDWITVDIETFYNKRLDIAYILREDGVKIAMPKYYSNKMFTEETKEQRLPYIKRGIEEREAKNRKSDKEKASDAFYRNHLNNNYKKRKDV